MGSVVSAIGRGINFIISAIAAVILTIIQFITSIIVTIFDVIAAILCCRCGRHRRGFSRGGMFGSRSRFGRSRF